MPVRHWRPGCHPYRHVFGGVSGPAPRRGKGCGGGLGSEDLRRLRRVHGGLHPGDRYKRRGQTNLALFGLISHLKGNPGFCKGGVFTTETAENQLRVYTFTITDYRLPITDHGLSHIASASMVISTMSPTTIPPFSRAPFQLCLLYTSPSPRDRS